jgi:hypothetical protein
VARQAGGGELLQRATTDAQGRYRLDGLPGGRVLVSASRPGFITRALAGGDASLLLDLSGAYDFADADFVVQPGGVITGRITDARGDPLEEAHIHLFRVTSPGAPHEYLRKTFTTDDRGVYRAFGLAPGRYILKVAKPESHWIPDRITPLYHPGISEAARAGEIEVGAGKEVTGIDLTFRPELVFRLSGRIADLNLPPEQMRHTILRAWSPEAHLAWTMAGPDGTFSFPRLPRGTYLLTARAPNRMITRQSLDLSADLFLTIRPADPVYITGRIVIADTGREPPAIRLRAVPRDPLQAPLETIARAPDYHFLFHDVWPGPHVIEIPSPPSAYFTAAKLGTPPAAQELEVPAGGISGLELRAGFGLAQVSGTVKATNSRPLPHARVALARPNTKPVELQTVSADQHGQFILGGIPPGEYLVGSFTIPADHVFRPEIWMAAGEEVRRIHVNAGAQVDLDLRVAP